MDSYAILKAIWNDPEQKQYYLACIKITDMARYPQEYKSFKNTWHGEIKTEYEQALKVLFSYRWHEPFIELKSV